MLASELPGDGPFNWHANGSSSNKSVLDGGVRRSGEGARAKLEARERENDGRLEGVGRRRNVGMRPASGDEGISKVGEVGLAVNFMVETLGGDYGKGD